MYSHLVVLEPGGLIVELLRWLPHGDGCARALDLRNSLG